MKNLLLILMFVLPTTLFSASPSCVAGMEVSIIDANGKVIKKGKLNSQGRLSLSGVDDAVWDVKLTNNGKSVVLGINNTKGKRGNPLHNSNNNNAENPLYNSNISEVKGGSDLLVAHEAAHVIQQKKGRNNKSNGNINTSRANIKNQRLDADSDDDGLDNDCDDAQITVTDKGNGRVEITVTILK